MPPIVVTQARGAGAGERGACPGGRNVFPSGLKDSSSLLLALFALGAMADEPPLYSTQRGADRFVAGGSALVSQAKGDLAAAAG